MESLLKDTQTVVASTGMKSNRNYLVHLLTILFGLGPWAAMNAFLLQYPLLVPTAPEGWNLGSYMVTAMQFGNIGPLVYTLYHKFSGRKPKDSVLIYGILLIGFISIILAIFTSDKTISVSGQEFSMPFLYTSFLSTFSAYTAVVICIPYVGKYPSAYLTTYMLGEAFGSLLPSLVALLQNTTSNDANDCTAENSIPKTTASQISSPYFYIGILMLILTSAVSFTLLEKLPVSKKLRSELTDSPERESNGIRSEEVSGIVYMSLLLLVFVTAFLVLGVGTSLQAYALLPYGADILQAGAALNLGLTPTACIICLFWTNRSAKSIWMLAVFVMSATLYVHIAAFMSPTPVLVGRTVGTFFILGCNIISVTGAYYVRISSAAILRNRGGRALIFYGVAMQLGDLMGAISGFILVNFSSLFHETDKCPL